MGDWPSGFGETFSYGPQAEALPPQTTDLRVGGLALRRQAQGAVLGHHIAEGDLAAEIAALVVLDPLHGADPLADDVALGLGHPGEDGQHQAAVRALGVADVAEDHPDAPLLEILKALEGVQGGAEEAIQPRGENDVAFSHGGQHLGPCWALPEMDGARDALLPEEALQLAAIGHGEASEHCLLRSEALALARLSLRTHPDVSVEGQGSTLSLKNSTRYEHVASSVWINGSAQRLARKPAD